MIISGVALLLLILATAGIERGLRRGHDATTLDATAHDRGSQLAVSAAFVLSLGALVCGTGLSFLAGIGSMPEPTLVGLVGLAVMLAGVAIRYAAMRTLGRFYTRTLRITDDHRLVDTGLYRYVRHPGYLGMILILGGADLATANWIAAVAGPAAIVGLYVYRIQAEEVMLGVELGPAYVAYAARTRRLVPFLW